MPTLQVEAALLRGGLLWMYPIRQSPISNIILEKLSYFRYIHLKSLQLRSKTTFPIGKTVENGAYFFHFIRCIKSLK